MIPLKQIFKLAVTERASVRAPAETSLRKRRRRRRQAEFSQKRKRKNRRAARRVSVQPGRQSTPTLSSKSHAALSLRSTLALAGIFLLLAANVLNRNDKLLQRAGNSQEQLFSPQIGLQENRLEDSVEKISPMISGQCADFAAPSELIEADHEVFAGASLRPTPNPAPFTGLALRGTRRGEPPADLIAKAVLPEDESQLPEISPKIGLRWKRLALIQTGSLGLAFMGIRKFDQYFGGAQRPFRLGNDWDKDHTLHFDELIHFQGSYRVAQGLIGLYRWSGVSETWSECLGAGTAASVMTLIEYIDGRRPKPKQGASFSDFTANLLGVGFALAKIHVGALEDIDFRLNYASFGDVFHKRTLLKYDRMTHWLTYSMKRQLGAPLHVGLGYGVKNAFKRNVRPEYYLGVGFTPLDILERCSPTTAKHLTWLGIYHFGLQVQMK